MEDSNIRLKEEYKRIHELVVRAKVEPSPRLAFNELARRFAPLFWYIKKAHYDSRWDRKELENMILGFFWEGVLAWTEEDDGPFSGFIRSFLLWKTYNHHKHLAKVEWRAHLDTDLVDSIDEATYRWNMDLDTRGAPSTEADLVSRTFSDIIVEVLTKKEQSFVELYYYKDFTEVAIAEMHKCSQPFVHKTRKKALRKIKRYVNDKPAFRQLFLHFMHDSGIREEGAKEITFYRCKKCRKCGFCSKLDGWLSTWSESGLKVQSRVVDSRRRINSVPKKLPCLVVCLGDEKRVAEWRGDRPTEKEIKEALFETIL